MVERNHDHTVIPGQVCAVIRDKLLTAAGPETAAMQPDHDRALYPVAQTACPNIQAQTVFIGETVVPVHGEGLVVRPPAGAFVLRTGGAVRPARTDFRPGIGILSRHETGCLGIRNSFEDEHTAVDVAGYGTRCRLDGRSLGRCLQGGRTGRLGPVAGRTAAGCGQQDRSKQRHHKKPFVHSSFQKLFANFVKSL